MIRSRHFIIQGKAPDGKRTSVSIHPVLAQQAIKKYDDEARFLADVRRMIAVGDDSWAVSAWLINFVSHPEQKSIFEDER